METKESLDDFTAEALRKKLKAKNLVCTGNKEELIDRYMQHQEAVQEAPAPDLSADVDELKDLLKLADETVDILKTNRYFKIDT